MIEWPIRAALASGLFDRLILSTDDPEIASIGKKLGVDVPFARPADLSDEHATTGAVIAHAIKALNIQPETPTCCLYATAPFVTPQDLIAGREALRSEDFVIPVTTFAFPIARAVRRNKGGLISMYNPDQYKIRSQDLEEAYHDAGMFYWALAKRWATPNSPFDEGVTSIVLPRSRVQDIDTPEDWDRAEAMFQALGLNAQ